jgi:hypothetical protein
MKVKINFALLLLITIGLVLIMSLPSCSKEAAPGCGKVIGKPAMLSIHSTYLDVDYGDCVLRFKVDLPTFTRYKIGDQYCE